LSEEGGSPISLTGKRNGSVPIIAALIVVALYAGTGWNHGLLYDDGQLIVDEPRPGGAAELAAAFTEAHYGKLPYYRPLVRITYIFQKAFHGDAARPYHLFNAAVAGAVMLAAFVLFRRRVFAIATWPALFAASWIALHPVASSCVYPIAGRDTLLPSLFALVAIAAWLTPSRASRIVALCALAAALFGKEQMVVVPALFVLADVAGQVRRSLAEWLARYLPVAAVVGGYLTVRAAVLANGLPGPSIGDDLLAPATALGYGLQVSLAPFAELVYEPPISVWLSMPRILFAACALFALIWAALRLRPEHRRGLWFWPAWFVVSQLPTASFFEQETSYDERYVFLALVGIGGIAASLLSALWTDRPARRAAAAVAVGVIVALGSLSIYRARFFEDSRAFYTQWIASDPGSAGGHNGLGVVLAIDGRTEEAIDHYREALRIRPDHAQAHGNLGQALWESGRAGEAESSYREALRLDPDHEEAHYNLANLLASRGDAAQAEQHYLAALAGRRGYAMAHNNYGAMLAAAGRFEEARTQFEAALRARPDHAEAHVNLGILLGREGMLEEAIGCYRRALAIDPAYPEAHFNLAAAIRALGRREEAISHLKSALRERPDWVEAERLLAEIEGWTGE
jgi:tetratricopeptide (TPR) repeat protein